MTVERTFVAEKVKEMGIVSYLKQQLSGAGFSHAEIKRTPMGTRVIIHAMRPGLVIGASGENVKTMTDVLKQQFAVENPNIEVAQVAVPELDAQLMAYRIANLLERGYYFKKVAHRALEKIVESGARGVEIRISGKLPSARAKTWKFRAGYIRFCGETVKREMDVGFADAQTKPGTVGIRVRLIRPNVRFPDEIMVGDNINKIILEEVVSGDSKKEGA